MAKPKRTRIPPTDDWQQLEALFEFPEQHLYELIRPVVLFGQPPVERAQATGTSERSLYRHVERFTQLGICGLRAAEPPRPPHTLPEHIKSLILELKAEYPPLRVNELATICFIRTGRRPDDKTINRILSSHPIPECPARRFPPYHQIPDPLERRRAIVRLHLEGWRRKSIAGYLQTSRETVHATIRRWVAEGVAGLEHKSRAPKRRVRKMTLGVMEAAHRIQRNPRIGAFRLSAALKQELGIKISPRSCGRILALNRQLYADLRHEEQPREKKPMPFQATTPHHYWSVDIRYLTRKEQQVPGVEVAYSITILENYSRTVLASVLSRSQDLSAYLLVLFIAITHYGTPKAIVSDGGAVFKANQAQTIYSALAMTHERIEHRQSWQNYAETMFNVQHRMADWDFAQATTWEELVAAHEAWVMNYNLQPHWAHRHREDNRHSPLEVLDSASGESYDEAALRRIFETIRFERHMDRAGYVHFRRWKIYGEYGLAHRTATIWLTAENLTISFSDQMLAHYAVRTNANHHQLIDVHTPQLIETAFRSPQLHLWTLDDDEWRKVVPPKHLQPLTLWEAGVDGAIQILPVAPNRRKKPRPPLQQMGLPLSMEKAV